MPRRPTVPDFFIVDPIDGTKEFIAGFDDYTINVALVSAGRPLLGLVSAPALGLLWRGLVGAGAERLTISRDGRIVAGSATKIHTRRCPERDWIAAVSRSHIDSRSEAFIKSRPGAVRKPDRLGAEILPGRRRFGRYLPAPRADVGMGYRGGPRGAGGRRRQGHRQQGRSLHFGGDPASLIVPELIAWGDPRLIP